MFRSFRRSRLKIWFEVEIWFESCKLNRFGLKYLIGSWDLIWKLHVARVLLFDLKLRFNLGNVSCKNFVIWSGKSKIHGQASFFSFHNMTVVFNVWKGKKIQFEDLIWNLKVAQILVLALEWFWYLIWIWNLIWEIQVARVLLFSLGTEVRISFLI